MTLEELGWNPDFEKEFAPFYKNGWKPARLIRDNKISYGAFLAEGKELEVTMSGKVYHDAESDAELPAVGDWVAIDEGAEDEPPMIRARLARRTCFSRKAPGKSAEEQVIAANVDVVVVVTDAHVDFNLRRMERYFTIIARSGAKPVVLINKSDLYPDELNQLAKQAIQELNREAEIYNCQAINAEGLEILKTYLKPGVSITLIGSSGVGKSTIVNQLLGEEIQWTGEVNSVTGKGIQTTTARELIVLPEGGILIDNPGIREVQMWTDENVLRESFSDLEEIAANCKFSDCKHGSDKGCAVREALENGLLDVDRYIGFLKLDEEIEKLQKRKKKRKMTQEKRNKRDKRAKAKKYDRKARDI